MPNDLFLVRHGESVGNVAIDAEKQGDMSLYTEEYLTTPGHRWRLTDAGRAQAAASGRWLREQFEHFDRYYASPYVRTRETAAHLGLPGARWTLNRALRERDWGDIGSQPMAVFKKRPEFELNYRWKKQDPLHWAPPNGESLAQVAEDRVRNVLSTLHRECDGQRVVAVTHADTLWAFRLVLERMTDEQFAAADADESQKITNCEVFHYTRLDPDTGLQASRMSWVRRIRPVLVGDEWQIQPSDGRCEWIALAIPTFSNDDLLRHVGPVDPVLTEAEITRAALLRQ